jgi:hypothetical protein
MSHSILKTLGKGQGYLKAGFLGFQGSGKTYTATLLAAAVRKEFGLTGPIAFVDTENATEYIAPLVRGLTGKDLIGDRTRDFEALLNLGQACVKEGVSVLVVDSMTHFWRSLCDAHLAGINKSRSKWNKAPKRALEFQDWASVKNEWARWTDFYLNSPLHILICGRAGFEYDMQKNEDSGRNELVKTGVKMKTEAEFGFEPSLLVEMAVEQEPDPKESGRFIQVRTAQVLKDRFAEIDGLRLVFQKQATKEAELKCVLDAFGPHVRRLKPGTHSTVDTKVTPLDVDEDGDAEHARERRRREILCEEIKGVLITGGLDGASSDAKTQRMALLAQIFGTRSWSAIETFQADKLRDGLLKLKAALGLAEERMVTDRPAAASEPPATSSEPEAGPDDDLFGAPAVEARADDPPPVVSQQPAVPGGPASELTPDEQAAVVAVINRNKGDLVKALAWMRGSHRGNKPWLGPDQGLEALTKRQANAVLAAGGRSFRTAAGLDTP